MNALALEVPFLEENAEANQLSLDYDFDLYYFLSYYAESDTQHLALEQTVEPLRLLYATLEPSPNYFLHSIFLFFVSLLPLKLALLVFSKSGSFGARRHQVRL